MQVRAGREDGKSHSDFHSQRFDRLVAAVGRDSIDISWSYRPYPLLSSSWTCSASQAARFIPPAWRV